MTDQKPSAPRCPIDMPCPTCGAGIGEPCISSGYCGGRGHDSVDVPARTQAEFIRAWISREHAESAAPESPEKSKPEQFQADYNCLSEVPADVLASRIVGKLIFCKGNLNKYARVIEGFISKYRAELRAGAPTQPAEDIRKALAECYVDIGALLNATTWELAPEVRTQLQKSHDLAAAALRSSDTEGK